MQFIRNSLIRQFLFGVVSALIIMSFLSALFQINKVDNDSKIAQQLEVNRMLNQLQDKISNMLYSRNNQLDAIFTHPNTIQGIASIQQRGIAFDGHPELTPVTTYFQQLIKLDPSVVNLFFTTTATWEYYDQVRKNEDPDYYINQRPFWQEFLSQMNHYVNDPYRDNDGKFLMTFRSPIYDTDKQLIGTAGLDLDLQQVNEELASLQSNYDGLEVFVVSDSGLMVSFPSMRQQMEKMRVDVLDTKEIDKVYQSYQAGGFENLWQNYNQKQQMDHQVDFNGQSYQVFMRKYDREVPEVNWSIAVMLPTEAIDAPVSDAIWENVTSIFLFTLSLGIFVWFFTRWQFKPLNEIQEAMVDISQGSADLTQRIRIKRADEIGQLAQAFNAFVEKIQVMVDESNQLAVQFTHDAKVALDDTNSTRDLIEQQKGQLANVASASVEMDQTTEHVAKRTEEISHISSSTRNGVASGVDKIEQASGQMARLAEQTKSAADVVAELEIETNSIGEVVEVIRGIAEQTNLLALNAAIEAARAGEQGRGFAVVADEVRNLASRTQDSTTHIHEIVAKLQTSALNAVSAMNNSQLEANEGKEFTLSIIPIFQEILGSMTDLEQHMVDIASTISEQSSTAAEMNRLIVDVDEIASETVEKSTHLAKQIQSTEDKSEALLQNLGKFKF
ncbi:methyl-accepting chemotaxis protein [Litorilituus lipolyticus]|uniref:Methyl-accepting chemotaxis protein n=1 Tax=Litorilituus lipolyticus TaxID=2491017 RepID=A0A502KXG2_9GAMM|nr:methyl-accepting chemotaxis protein [Litorilituus lipolyticus]TPH14671.1 methyl-accepting chemotaxis protein [Litorilituus lipolyticus]